MKTRRMFERAAGIVASVVALGGAGPAPALAGAPEWTEPCGAAPPWSRTLTVCVDLIGTPRLVAQSRPELLANRSVDVWVRAPAGTSVRVSLSGEPGLVQQTTWGRSGEGPTEETTSLVFHLAPRIAAEGESSVTLEVASWVPETPEVYAARRLRVEGLLVYLSAQSAPEAEARLVRAERAVATAAEALAAADSNAAAATGAAAEAARLTQTQRRDEHTQAIRDRAEAGVILDAARRAVADLEWLRAPDGLVKAEGIALLTSLPDPATAPSPQEVATSAAALRSEVERPPITRLESAIAYNKGVVGAFNVGSAIIVGPRARTYEASPVGDDQAELTETTGGGVDVELVATYTQYLYAVPDVPNSRFLGVSGGIAFASLANQDGLPGSLYLGLAGGFRNISLGAYAVVRDVDELRPGAAVGDTIAAGADLPLNHGYRLGFAAVLNFTPELFAVKR